MVVISHGTGEARDVLLYPFWIDQAVPIFLMIQVFHAYKRDTVNYPSFSKLWSRIMKPFLAIQCLMVVYYLIRYFFKNEDFTENMLLLVKNGGHGPGSYYIWIYLQFSIILPLFTKLVKKRYAAAYFIGCSIGIEIICSYIDMPDYIYRLLFLRYFFLVYLGYLWVKRGIVLNKINILLSIISITAIGLLYYGKSFGLTVNMNPLSLLPIGLYSIGSLISCHGHSFLSSSVDRIRRLKVLKLELYYYLLVNARLRYFCSRCWYSKFHLFRVMLILFCVFCHWRFMNVLQ